MTVDEVRTWAIDHLRRGEEPAAFYVGVADATYGTFDESQCEAAGFVWETNYCEGGREGLLRLEQATPAGRLQHGTTVGG